ncbi:MAG: hypothetical protein CMA21_04570 [Euryarchaeota archaeon]|nr:hypothetical protein [Euryarchaeota archaeon]|tara:strand:- start:1482 stop:2159 length:678 start_codon:yes stop_codon:yes gene_type:complete
MKKKKTRITLIGVGGIGSNLIGSIAPAISSGPLVESLGGISLRIIDSDVVERRNLLMGQRFRDSDVGKRKVDAIKDAISDFESGLLEVIPIADDVRSPKDIPNSDLAIVCVDNMDARGVVHRIGIPWLDLRCSGDGYIAIDHRVEEDVVKSLTMKQNGNGSCQLEGWESGFLQSGYLAAAAHGYQWLIAALRQMDGFPKSALPNPRSSSVTFGVLGNLPKLEGFP